MRARAWTLSRRDLWDDVYAGELARTDEACAVAAADEAVRLWDQVRREIAWLTVRWWATRLGVALAVGVVLSGVGFGIFLLQEPSRSWAGESRGNAVRDADAMAEQWYDYGLQLVAVRAERRGGAPVWYVVYRDRFGHPICVDINAGYEYAGVCVR